MQLWIVWGCKTPLCNAAKEEIPFGGTFCPDKRGPAGTPPYLLGAQWHQGHTVQRSDFSPGDWTGQCENSVQEQYWLRRGRSPGKLDWKPSRWLCVYRTYRVAAGTAMSTGYGTPYRFCPARQACQQHGKQPGGTGLVGRAWAWGPLCNTRSQAPTLTRHQQVWSGGQPQAHPQQATLVFPASSSTHTSLLLLLPTTHIRQELHPSVLMTQSLFRVKSFKCPSSSMLIILPFNILDTNCISLRWMNFPLLHKWIYLCKNGVKTPFILLLEVFLLGPV